MKKFFRKLLTRTLYSILGLLLLLLPTAFLLSFVFTQPKVVKSVLHDSDVYTAISDSTRESMSATVVAQRPAIPRELADRAVNQVVTPEVTEKKTTQFIDDMYAWLEGRNHSFTPQFDVSQETQQLSGALTNAVIQSIMQKPECSVDQTQQLVTALGGVNPTLDTMLGWPCRIPGLDLNKLAQDAVAAPADANAPSLDAANVAALLAASQTNANPQSSSPDILKAVGSAVVGVYQVLRWSFYILLPIILLLIGILWLLGGKKHLTFSRRSAKVFAVNGALLLVYTVISLWLLANSAQLLNSGPFAQLAASQAALRPFAYLSGWITIGFGVLYCVIAAVLFWYHQKLRQQKLAEEASTSIIEHPPATLNSQAPPTPAQITQEQPTIQEVIRYNRDHD